VSRDLIFQCWAPEGAHWSRWTKPVVFAFMRDTPSQPNPQPASNLDQVPTADGKTALVLDLPGALGVETGLALAEKGYRPIPLYNSAPGPDVDQASTSQAVVEVLSILNALWHGAEHLRSIALLPSAPPVFLLDRNRRHGKFKPLPGHFDNRSVSFPTDFPSAHVLAAAGISHVLLIQPSDGPPEADLAHTLRRWQEAGLELQSLGLNPSTSPRALQVPRPSYFRLLWYRLLLIAGLRRNPLGGFGGLVPEPSSSG